MSYSFAKRKRYRNWLVWDGELGVPKTKVILIDTVLSFEMIEVAVIRLIQLILTAVTGNSNSRILRLVT